MTKVKKKSSYCIENCFHKCGDNDAFVATFVAIFSKALDTAALNRWQAEISFVWKKSSIEDWGLTLIRVFESSIKKVSFWFWNRLDDYWAPMFCHLFRKLRNLQKPLFVGSLKNKNNANIVNKWKHTFLSMQKK